MSLVADKLERLTNLLTQLLDTPRPLTREELVSRLAGQYPADATAQRTAFERDKALLRDEGVPIDTVVLDSGAVGYRVQRRRYELPDLGLEPDELVALHLAVAAVRTGGTWGEEALWKLGDAEGAAMPPLASVPALPALPALHRAGHEGAIVSFTYRDERRTVDPWGLLFRNGFWYLVGFDRTRGAERVFRVDRIADGDVEVGEPGSATARPAGAEVRRALPAEAWEIGEGERIDAEVLVDDVAAGRVVRELGEDRVVARRRDGSVVVRIAVTNRPAFRSWLLGLLERAEVLRPPELRAEVVDWLRRIAESPCEPSDVPEAGT